MQPLSCTNVGAALGHARGARLTTVDRWTSTPSRRSSRRAAATSCGRWVRRDAVLAGGTWLFSEPQPHLRRLVDLDRAGLAADHAERQRDRARRDLHARRGVGAVDASCRRARPDWLAAPLFHQCCTALLASFKIWRTATVGGNLCLSLPAGAMISLASALDGDCVVWRRRRRRLPAAGPRVRHRDGHQRAGRRRRAARRFTCPPRRCGRARRTASWRCRRWAGRVSW